jgi:hypothetical protein
LETIMITRANHLRRLAALSALFVLGSAAIAGAQGTAAPRWDAWLGCWQASVPVTRSAAETIPRVCVARTNSNSAVEISTEQGGKVVSRDTIDASGQAQAVSMQGCSGTKRAQWSADSRRVFLRSELTCGDNLKRTSTAILAISPTGEWLDVQGVAAGGNSGVRVTRYHDAGTIFADSSSPFVNRGGGRQLALNTARTAAGSTLSVTDIAEAVRQVDTSVVQAWIVERGAKFQLTAPQLIALADAGVPGSVTDVMVGVAYPEHFALAQRPALVASGFDASPLDSARLVSRYLNDRCYGMMDPFWNSPGLYDPCGTRYGYRGYAYGLSAYSPYSYGLYGGGYSSYGSYGGGYVGYYGAPVVIVRGEGTQHGTLIKGVGYTSGGSSSGGSSSGRSSGSSTSSGSGSSGSSGSGSGSSGSSGSSSSGSSGGRTAVARPPL